MFAYCNNNPISYVDPDGESPGAIAIVSTSIAANSWNPIGWVLVGVVVTGVAAVAICDVYEKNAHKTKILADVKVKKQSDNQKLYQLAYVNELGMLIKVGKKMTFTEALAALGISGAVNSLSKTYTYDRGKASSAQRALEHLGSGNWGIYASNQFAAKALAFVFGCTAPPEVHGWGMYGHYHDSTHSFHIWYGGVLYY